MTETSEEFRLTAQIAEHLRTRFYGKYRGLVTDIGDPENLARIKAQVPSVFGIEDNSPWAMPSVPFAGPKHGLVLLPEVGDGVWIEFEAGDLSRPIWSGCWWARGQPPQPQGETIRLLSTKANHQIVIDENADEIRLVHPRRRDRPYRRKRDFAAIREAAKSRSAPARSTLTMEWSR
jgi:uncharacterized protein involved in type VI secretion and phage assembly